MSPRRGKGCSRGDLDELNKLGIELDSDEELEEALLRELSELSGCNQHSERKA